jgi:RNA polymerase sigma factor (sigma-70 family)
MSGLDLRGESMGEAQARGRLKYVDPHNLESGLLLWLPTIRTEAEAHRADIIRECLDQLPDTQKRAIESYYFLSMSFQAIAREEGVTYQPIQRRVSRGLKRLKQLIEDRGGVEKLYE